MQKLIFRLAPALFVLLLATAGSAQAEWPVTLLVFQDLDGDGIRQPVEPPLAGVLVSDQRAVARTDAQGMAAFLCRPEETRFCYASIPEGCSLRGRAWARIPYPGPEAEKVRPLELAIGLRPLTEEEAAAREGGFYTFVQTSDIHVASAEAAATFRLDLEEIGRLRPRPAFIAATGDLVNRGDRTQEYQHYREGLRGTSLPHFNIIGNHDADRGPTRVGNFEAHLGPRNYSWNIPHYRCLAVDSVHYDQAQEAWLLAELGNLEPGRRALVFQHYLPTDEFLETLAHHPVAAVISGHWHGQRMRRFRGILDLNTSPLRFGGIDRSPRGFRLITVQPDGSLETEFRVGGLHRHLRIVSPVTGDGPRGRRVAVVVAFADTVDPGFEVEVGLGPPEEGQGPVAEAEHDHDGNGHAHLRRQGTFFWVGYYQPEDVDEPQHLQVKVTTRGGEQVVTQGKALLGPERAPAHGGAFAQHRGSPLKTGSVPLDGDLSGGLALLWTARAGPGNLGSPVVAEDRVVVAVPAESVPEDAALACFDARSGRLRWQATTDGSVAHTPAIDQGRVVVVTQTGQVHAFSLQSGEPLFRISLGKPSRRWDISAPTVREGRAWLGCGQGFGAVCLDDGSLLWSHGAEDSPPEPWSATDWWPSSYQSPALSGDLVAFGHRTALVVMEALTGRVTWWAEGKNALPAFDREGETLWAILDRKLCAYRRSTSEDGSFEPFLQISDDLGDTTAMPAVAADRVVVTTGTGELRAYAAADGTLLWSRPTDRGLTSQRPYGRGEAHLTGSPLLVGRFVVAGGTDGILRVLDLRDGTPVTQRDLGVPLTGSPAFAGGVLYLTTWDGNLLALAP